MDNSTKIYVKVKAIFTKEGLLLPKSIYWKDGREYSIDKVLDIRPAAALKAGGQGDRYTVRIGGYCKYLFFEHQSTKNNMNLGRWFVESKN